MTSPATKNNTHNYITLTPSRLQLSLEPLTYDRYWRFSIVPSNISYAFCQEMETAPINTIEFKQANANFPILFFQEDDCFTPHALLSLLPKVNLALRNNTEWRNELYLPDEFRSYPFGIIDVSKERQSHGNFADSFSLTTSEGQPTALLGIAPRNSMLVSSQERHALSHPLFLSDGSATPYVQSIIAAQTQRNKEKVDTQAFCTALAANGILSKRSITLSFKDSTQLTLDGFFTVSKTGFKNISEHTLKRWKDLGYIDLLEMHWNSLNKWNILMMLHERHLNRAIRNLRQSQKAG